LMDELRNLKLSSESMFINRVLFSKDIGGCRRCHRARQWQLETLANLRQRYPGTALYVVRNFPTEIAGRKALLHFTGELWRLP
jgi:hypothetical protein